MSPDARGHRSSRSWLIAGLIFAVVATAVLVLSDDARWLRLGIVAALWAALLGGFLASHYRRQADRLSESMEDAQEVYELELEREIAARREYELEIEADARSRAEELSRGEIDALRNEVASLRGTLEKLFGGEVLYERVALTAQSTRMRSLPDEPKRKTLSAGEQRNGELPSVVSGSAARPYDKLAADRTDLIARVLDPEPSRRDLPSFDREPPRREAARSEPARREPPRSEPLRAETPRAEPPRTAPSREPVRPEPRREPERLSWFTADAESSSRSKPAEPKPKPASPKPSVNGTSSLGAGRHGFPARNGVEPPVDPADSGDLSAAMAASDAPSGPVNRTLPPEIQHGTGSGGRRRKPDPEPTETFSPPPRSRHSKHGSGEDGWPESEPVQPAERSWPALPSLSRMPSMEPAPEPEPPAGSHASGRSVAELLAAYGADQPPRRRRRKD